MAISISYLECGDFYLKFSQATIEVLGKITNKIKNSQAILHLTNEKRRMMADRETLFTGL